MVSLTLCRFLDHPVCAFENWQTSYELNQARKVKKHLNVLNGNKVIETKIEI